MRGSSTLWRAMEKARRSNLAAAGEPAPVPGAHGATRRALLKAIVAAGAVSALPRPARAEAGRVVIVGGGIAGLSALHHLREAGVDAMLCEARGRLGGRIFTQRPAAGPAFEAGGQLVNTDHHDMQALARAFGIALVDRKAGPSRALILADGRPVPDAALAEALGPIAAQIGSDADRLDKDYARVAAELDAISIRAYLDRHAALVPAPWVRRLLEHGCRTEYGVEPDRASAIELVFNLPTVDGERVELLGGSDERFVIERGSGALIDAMRARHLPRILLGRRLLRVARRRGGLRLHFLDGSAIDADTVIVAVPAPVTRQIDFGVPLPAAWRAFIERMELGRNEKVQAAAGASPWARPMGAGGALWETDPESGYALAWDGSVPCLDRGDSVWTWFLGGDQCGEAAPADALARRFAASSERGVPGLAAAVARGPFRRTAWHRDALTLGGYVNYAPGMLTRFGRLLWIDSDDPEERRAARAGSILFAGEHLSDAFPGYMNGAAQTGRLAAEAITGRRMLSQAA